MKSTNTSVRRGASPSPLRLSRTSSMSSISFNGMTSPIPRRTPSAVLSPGFSISSLLLSKEFVSTSSTFVISDLCGSEYSGNTDGPFSKCKFNGICGMTQMPQSKNVVLSETVNSTLKLINLNEKKVVTLCRTGLLQPKGVCMYTNHQILVCDSGHHRIRLFDISNGKLSFFAGNGQKGYKDGKLAEAQFDSPSDVICVVDEYERKAVYVSDTSNHVIRKIDVQSGRVSTVAGGLSSGAIIEGCIDGNAMKEALFRFPVGLCVDSMNPNVIFIADSGNDCLRKLSLNDNQIVTVAKGYFNNPTGVCSSSSDHGVIICDTLNHRIVKLLRGTKQTGVILCGRKAVSGHHNGRCKEATLSSPNNVLSLGNDRFLVSDSGNNMIRLIEPFTSESEPPSPYSLVPTPTSTQSNRAPQNSSPERKKQEMSFMASMLHTPQKIPKDEKLFMDRMKYYSRTIRLNRSLAHLNSNGSNNNDIMNTIMNSIDQLRYYESIFQYEQTLTHIFLYYTSVLNKSTETSASLELGGVRFLKFVKDSKLIDEKQLSSNNVFLVFSEATKHSPTHRMNIDEFIHGICLLACRKFHDSKESGVSSTLQTIAEMVKHHTLVHTYVDQALDCYILPNAKRITLSPTPTILSSSSIIGTWAHFEDVLFKIFQFYSTSRQSKREAENWQSYQRGLYTLNIDEFFSFAKDFSIFPNIISKNIITSLFYSCCQGNYVLQGIIGVVKAGENISIDFWEFLDCLGRIALLRFGESPLHEIYTTPESKIEALMEHLNMSDGRKRFAADTGGRLFPNLSSKTTGVSYKSKLQQYIAFHPSAIANSKRSNRSDRSQLLNYSHFSSNRNRASVEQLDINYSSGGNRQATRGMERNRGSSNNLIDGVTVTCEEENGRIKCHQQDVILMHFDQNRGSWKPMAQGVCELRDLLIPNEENLELKFTCTNMFVEDCPSAELIRRISIQNLPHIESHELIGNAGGLDEGEHKVSLHVWRRGPGHLFNPDIAYALQFPSESASFPFEQQYEAIRRFSHESEENNSEEVEQPRDIDYPNTHIQRNTDTLGRSDRLEIPNMNTYDNNIVDPEEGKFLTSSMLNTPDPVRRTTRANMGITYEENGNQLENLEDKNVSSSMKSHVLQSYEQLITDQIMGYLNGFFDKLKAEKNDETIDEMENSFGEYKVREALNSTIVNNGNSGLQHLLAKSHMSINDGVQQRIRLSTALYSLQSGINTQSFDRERIQELLLHYVAMDPLLLKSLTSVRHFNENVRQCLSHSTTKDQLFIELFCKDALGEGLIFYENGFCVASEEVCSAEMHITNSLPTIEFFETIMSVDVQVQGKSISQQQMNKELGLLTKKLQIVCEEERGTILITIPFAAPDFVEISETEDMNDMPIQNNIQHPIKETFKTYHLLIEVVIELTHGASPESLKFKHQLPLHVFPNHSSLDRTRGNLRKHGNAISHKLPSQFKPMKILGMQQLVQGVSQNYSRHLNEN